MPVLTKEREKKLKYGISCSDESAFSELFVALYGDLVLYAGRYVWSKDICEDIVQTVFTRLWNDRATIMQISSLKAFLIQSVKNSCLDHIRHKTIIQRHTEYSRRDAGISDMSTYDYVLYSELRQRLDEALTHIPDDCRQAFELNRFSDMSYKEIAQKLSVSERTVEVRISKTLSMLRVLLKDYFVLIIMLFCKNM